MLLKRLGFHTKWIQWVMECLTTVLYTYFINGSAQGLVRPTRGLRQGDPLSPYIFILCSEVLSGLCHITQEEGRFLGIRVSQRSPRVNHLLFADDMMIFCQANSESCKELLSILKKYEGVSGQNINRQKLAIMFSAKTSNIVKQQVLVGRE